MSKWSEIFKTSLAKEHADLNYIQASTTDDKKSVVVSMHLGKMQVGWIKYDKDQLTELINLLQVHKDELE